MPVLDVNLLIENRVSAIKAYHKMVGIKRAQLDVSGGVDAAEAFWLPISDLALHEENFFSDHFYILNYFLRGIGK